MRNELSKSDWKHFKAIREVALERLCARILDNVCETASDKTKTSHERFLAVYQLVNDSNRDVARGFDFLSRSRMFLQLVSMQQMNLIEQTGVEGFSEEVRQQLARFDRLN